MTVSLNIFEISDSSCTNKYYLDFHLKLGTSGT